MEVERKRKRKRRRRVNFIIWGFGKKIGKESFVHPPTPDNVGSVYRNQKENQ